MQVLAACLLGVASLALVGGFAWFKLTAESQPELVADTLCPIDGPRSVTVVLLDASDDIPAIGRRQLTTYLSDLADGLPDYGLLELRLLDPAVGGGRTVFSRCNPGNGANLSQLVANPAGVRRRWTETFQEPLRAALDEGMTPAASETSPIMETIQQIAVERFYGRSVEDIDKRLIVVSDMIEHGPSYSQYREGVSFAAFSRSPASRAFATDLHGADVSIRLVQRASARFDVNEQVEFWQDWFEANRGRVRDIEKVQGAG